MFKFNKTCSFFQHWDKFCGFQTQDFGDSALSNQKMRVVNVQLNAFEEVFDFGVRFIVTIEEVFAFSRTNLSKIWILAKKNKD